MEYKERWQRSVRSCKRPLNPEAEDRRQKNLLRENLNFSSSTWKKSETVLSNLVNRSFIEFDSHKKVCDFEKHEKTFFKTKIPSACTVGLGIASGTPKPLELERKLWKIIYGGNDKSFKTANKFWFNFCLQQVRLKNVFESKCFLRLTWIVNIHKCWAHVTFLLLICRKYLLINCAYMQHKFIFCWNYLYIKKWNNFN